jgi:RNA polymerase sigma-70 factor (ECF subfamily)
VSPSDQQLLARVASGDRAAFGEFYDRHSGRIFALLQRLLRVRPEAEDALQETFWQVWRRAGAYDAARGSPGLWLVMIARSRALDRLRGLERIPPRLPQTESATDTDASELAEQSEASRLARSALARLPAEQSRAISLAFYSGLTHEQIAEAQGVPLGTIKTRIRLGMRRLREMLVE